MTGLEGLEVYRPQVPTRAVPARGHLLTAGQPASAGTAAPIEYGDELVVAPTWTALKAKPRQVMEGLGLNPCGDVEESFVCYDVDCRTVAWWVDAVSGAVTVYFRRENLAHRYPPTDPEVIVRRAVRLPSVPVASAEGLIVQLPGSAPHGARWADSWFAGALWQNLPDKVKGHLAGAVEHDTFTGRNMAIRRRFKAEQRAEEIIYMSMWDKQTLAGAWCRRVGSGACPDQVSATQLLAGRPWQCVVFRVPLAVTEERPALPSGQRTGPYGTLPLPRS